MKTIKEQLLFWGKVARNGFILAGLYFFSVWAGAELTWTTLKPLLIFFGTYVLTELARYYGLRGNVPTKNKKGNINITTLLY